MGRAVQSEVSRSCCYSDTALPFPTPLQPPWGRVRTAGRGEVRAPVSHAHDLEYPLLP